MLPHTEYSLVPVLFGLSRQTTSCTTSAPLLRMCGTAASVSTLLIVVGWPNTPATAGKRRLDARIAAPPLERVHQRGLFAADVRARAAMHVDVDRLPVPIAFLPRMPAAYASLTAASIRASGSVNSPRM